MFKFSKETYFNYDSRGNIDSPKPRIFIDPLVTLLVLVLLIAFWPIRTVPTGTRGVVTIGGSIRGIENEGFTWIWPWQKLDLFSTRAESADVKNAEGSTSDQQPVTTSLTVRYAIEPGKVAHVFEYYNHTGDLDSYVSTASLEVFKAVTARYTAPDLIAKRQEVSTAIAAGLQTKLVTYGAKVINIDMTNFAFSKTYMDAINAKVTQDQLLQTAEKKALTVAAEQKQKVAIAEAEATALRAKADGEAYAQLKVATAQAESLRIQNAALAQNKDVLELRRIEVEMAKASKWDGSLPQNIYAGAPIPFLNVNQAK